MTTLTSILASFALATAVAATGFAQSAGEAAPGIVPAAPAVRASTTPLQPQAAPAQVQASPVQAAPYVSMSAGPRVLVIPFVTLNVPEGQEWIGRAVQENIVADFGRARAFSPIEFKGELMVEDNATAIALAHKANADYVIRGAAQIVDQNLRITAQFIDTRNGDTIGTASVTGATKDLLKLEDGLSAELRVSVTPIVTAQQQPQYAPGYLGGAPAQGADTSYTPGYSPYYPAPTYTPSDYTPTYGPDYSSAYDPGYSYGYGYPYYGGFYGPSVVFVGGGFFGDRFHHGFDHGHDGHDGHGGHVWTGGNWNNGGWHQGGTIGPSSHGNVGFSTNFNGGGRVFSGGIVGGGIRPVSGNVSSGGFQGGIVHGPSSFGGGFSRGMSGGFSGGGFGGGMGGFGGGGFGGGHGGGGGGGHR